jgi:CubicO group peptidase (beta-lactamase class C family)
MSALGSIADQWTTIFEQMSSLGVAGAVAGVAVGEEQLSMAHGVANLNTGQPFTEDTGFLLGSVTKVLTATVLMRLVGRGEVDLDASARRYVPEFSLRDVDAAERITVRMLVNHTNGMDADALRPTAVRGRDAARSYTEQLAKMGVLFEPGSGLHYSNPGFVVAARVIEECTGLPFERAIQQELFGPAGMHDATAVQTQAFLRRTAIGAFAGQEGERLRATSLFSLAESGAGCGATTIGTVADIIAFGRMHLRGGTAVNGQRVLSAELVRLMRTPTYDLGIPQAPPIGLGWWLVPIAGTTALWHGGGSPGGTSSFCILPEFDAVIVSYASGPGGPALHDQLHLAAVDGLTGRSATPPLEFSPGAVREDLAGEYASFQRRVTVAVKGDELILTEQFEPYDEEHRKNHEGYTGGAEASSTAIYRSVSPGRFAVTGTEPASLSGFFGRMRLLDCLPAARGRRTGLHQGFRYIPKIR